jgi:hypothetical protein
MGAILRVADLEFRSKAAIHRWARETLAQYTHKGPIPEPDHSRVMALLQRHPRSAEKIGCGVQHFIVAPPIGMKGVCFHAVRVDGSVATFSYKTAADAKDGTFAADFSAAARHTIADEVAAVRRAWFARFPEGNAVCAATGEPILPHTCEVDHQGRYEFADICKLFLRAYRIDLSRDLLSDPLTQWRFRNFHRVMARLVVVSRDYHRGRSRQRQRALP